jgi:alpha,alpha-trehalase
LLNRYWDDVPAPRDEAFARDLAAAAQSERPAGEVYRDIRAGAESGWDFSSRWFADAASCAAIATTSIAPVDLNALLFGLERAIAAASEASGRAAEAALFQRRADARREAVTRYCWREDAGVFCDVEWRTGAARADVTAAALAPLFTGMASADQAARTAARVEADLLAPGGLLTTTRETGEQWDAPNGWAPLHWIAVEGLRAYGHERLAREIAARWVATVARVFAQTGRFMEKYDVRTSAPGGGGEYPLQDGFGWTNGVTRALLDLYPELARFEATRAPARA